MTLETTSCPGGTHLVMVFLWLYGGVLSHGGTPKSSSILDWDFLLQSKHFENSPVTKTPTVIYDNICMFNICDKENMMK